MVNAYIHARWWVHGAGPRESPAFPDPTAVSPALSLPSVEELWGKPSTRATTCRAQPPAAWPAWPPRRLGRMHPGRPPARDREGESEQASVFATETPAAKTHTGHREESSWEELTGARGV